MNEETTYLRMISQAETPESLREIILSFGFSGLFFQRWFPSRLDIWEALRVNGFLELYHGSQIYKQCPVAQAIYTWSRDYTFAQARAEIKITGDGPAKAEALFTRFGGADGVVVLTGDNLTKAAVIVLSDEPVEEIFRKYGDLLSFSARKLTRLLEPGHRLLENSDRADPTFSQTQNKIIQMQIDHPYLSNTEIADRLGLSVNTLLSHHKKIAKKIGAPSFTGAVVQRIKS